MITRTLDSLTFTRSTEGEVEYHLDGFDATVLRDPVDGGWAIYEYGRERYIADGFRTMADAKAALPRLIALGHVAAR